MRRQATRTLTALAASALALSLLVATAEAAARWIEVQPLAGAPGTHVHVVITDTAAVRLTSTLALYPYRSDFACVGTPTEPNLGELHWDGTLGTGDFVVPAVLPGRYLLEEIIPGIPPPLCLPVRVFTVLGPNSAFAPEPPSALTLIGIWLLLAAGLWILLRRTRLAAVQRGSPHGRQSQR